MSDAEVLCEFMEPPPTGGRPEHGSNEVWWRWGWHYVGPSLPHQETPVEYCWLPRKLTLNECREIEAKLTDEQWIHYRCNLSELTDLPKAFDGSQWVLNWAEVTMTKLLHASAAQKITALAVAIRAPQAATAPPAAP